MCSQPHPPNFLQSYCPSSFPYSVPIHTFRDMDGCFHCHLSPLLVSFSIVFLRLFSLSPEPTPALLCTISSSICCMFFACSCIAPPPFPLLTLFSLAISFFNCINLCGNLFHVFTRVAVVAVAAVVEFWMPIAKVRITTSTCQICSLCQLVLLSLLRLLSEEPSIFQLMSSSKSSTSGVFVKRNHHCFFFSTLHLCFVT